MLRKENRNPNPNPKTANTSKTAINKSTISHSITPEHSTRMDYKPRFIKKNIHIHDELIHCPNPTETIHHSQTYINSPASFTENNTVDIQSIMSNKIKWRENTHRVQQELQKRTEKFNASIKYFHQILTDMGNVANDQSIPCRERLYSTSTRISELLAVFQEFNIETNQ